jgi:hypothetical protein
MSYFATRNAIAIQYVIDNAEVQSEISDLVVKIGATALYGPVGPITADLLIHIRDGFKANSEINNGNYFEGTVDFTKIVLESFLEVFGDSNPVLGYPFDLVKIGTAATTAYVYGFFFGVDVPQSLMEPKSTLPVSTGGTATISHDFLWSYDIDNITGAYGNPADITYTVTAPSHGTLLLNGTAANTFTQADIDDGLVRYHENGDAATSDGFIFTVTDLAGNHITEDYQIVILNTNTPVIEANGNLAASIGSSTTIFTDSLCTVALGNDPTELKYSVVSGPSHGAVVVNGAPANSFTQAEIDDHRVQYRQNGDATTHDSFTFQATDAAGDQTPIATFNIVLQPSAATATSAGAPTATADSNNNGWQRSVPDGYQMVGVGDFHGNGASDILLRNPTSGDVAELRSDNGMTFSDIGWAGPGWEVVGTTDLNGDGTTDIVLDFQGSGAVGAFVMNDGHPTWALLGSTIPA